MYYGRSESLARSPAHFSLVVRRVVSARCRFLERHFISRRPHCAIRRHNIGRVGALGPSMGRQRSEIRASYCVDTSLARRRVSSLLLGLISIRSQMGIADGREQRPSAINQKDNVFNAPWQCCGGNGEQTCSIWPAPRSRNVSSRFLRVPGLPMR